MRSDVYQRITDQIVAELEKGVREIRGCVEDEPLHAEACEPEGRDHHAHGAGKRFTRGERARMGEADRAERDDHEHDEAAVNPKQLAQ